MMINTWNSIKPALVYFIEFSQAFDRVQIITTSTRIVEGKSLTDEIVDSKLMSGYIMEQDNINVICWYLLPAVRTTYNAYYKIVKRAKNINIIVSKDVIE